MQNSPLLKSLCGMVILILTLFSNWSYSQDSINYNLQNLEGNQYKISWTLPSNAIVYISFLGKQGPVGESIVKPENSTIYSMIANINGQTFTESAEAKVHGARGDGYCPDQDMFTQYRYQYKVPLENGITNFLDLVRQTLQEELGFSIIEDHLDSDGRYVFLTACSQRDYLLEPDENTLAARTIAYRVELTIPDQYDEQIVYSIKCALQYRKKVVKTFRREDNEKLHRQEALRLHNKLEQIID